MNDYVTDVNDPSKIIGYVTPVVNNFEMANARQFFIEANLWMSDAQRGQLCGVYESNISRFVARMSAMVASFAVQKFAADLAEQQRPLITEQELQELRQKARVLDEILDHYENDRVFPEGITFAGPMGCRNRRFSLAKRSARP